MNNSERNTIFEFKLTFFDIHYHSRFEISSQKFFVDEPERNRRRNKGTYQGRFGNLSTLGEIHVVTLKTYRVTRRLLGQYEFKNIFFKFKFIINI